MTGKQRVVLANTVLLACCTCFFGLEFTVYSLQLTMSFADDGRRTKRSTIRVVSYTRRVAAAPYCYYLWERAGVFPARPFLLVAVTPPPSSSWDRQSGLKARVVSRAIPNDVVDCEWRWWT
jgi:hypothetical protein